MFEGVTVALVTPFKDGQVDFAKIDELVAWHVHEGTDCLLPCGTTGESPTLSHDEHDKVVDAVVKAAGSTPLKVLAGAGSNSTAEAVRLVRHAAQAGADGALVIVPYYNKPTQEGIYRHFKVVAESADIPVVIYNVPGRTARAIEPETVFRLAEIPNIVAVKDAADDVDVTSTLCVGCDLTILSGADSLNLPILSVGGTGIVSVVGNLVPADLKAMLEAHKAADAAEALRWHQKLFGLCRAMFYETNPIPVKTAMKLLGRLNGELRLPLCEMGAANERRLAEALETYGLL